MSNRCSDGIRYCAGVVDIALVGGGNDIAAIASVGDGAGVGGDGAN